MKKVLLVLMVLALKTQAAFVELKNVQEFENLVKTSPVPVVVQFEAYWCGPCQQLKAMLTKIAPSYQDSQVRLAHVDAYLNKSLQVYLQGGFPTVRTFYHGALAKAAFVGSQEESFVRDFIDSVIHNPAGFEEEFVLGESCAVN